MNTTHPEIPCGCVTAGPSLLFDVAHRTRTVGNYCQIVTSYATHQLMSLALVSAKLVSSLSSFACRPTGCDCLDL